MNSEHNMCSPCADLIHHFLVATSRCYIYILLLFNRKYFYISDTITMAENMKEEFKEEIKEEAFEKEEFFLSFSSEEIFTVDVQREDVNIENKGVTFGGGG